MKCLRSACPSFLLIFPTASFCKLAPPTSHCLHRGCVQQIDIFFKDLFSSPYCCQATKKLKNIKSSIFHHYEHQVFLNVSLSDVQKFYCTDLKY